ncbi:MAG: OmpA family protein [Flavobacterium sp.]|jgi:outer membrane protein OmpA-like peptidoglycan-associated protein|uniref:OmpA family protein n=1 Tax=Flavobacterium sp. TaxID=239 RepID=UPI0022BFF407|nr:OmpA family protein [Flavobacterium sp.]MCZ8168499.1 OmpA family protein [Flavobacterium sp.]MCZ8298518.1 OmpA family protein [Flavobacterium sp.]
MRKILFVFLFLFNFLSAQRTISVYFEVDQSSLSLEEAKKLVINFQLAHFKVIEIRGYCDARGSIAYNDALAQRRINGVLQHLDELSISYESALQKVIGERQLEFSTHAQNRRVDLVVETLPKIKDSVLPNAVEKIEQIAPLVEETLTPEEQIAEEAEQLETQLTQSKAGTVFKIKNLNFVFNSDDIEILSLPLLDKLLEVMYNFPKLEIEIHGYICCNPDPNDTKLSIRRAHKIYRYLTQNGIDAKRLGYKGFGSSNPIFPLPEKSEAEKAANRRVEILIKHAI